MSDQVHMRIAIPLECPVSQVVGYLNGKSGIHLAQVSS
jgi:REP element-mobilizing transposase RayT